MTDALTAPVQPLGAEPQVRSSHTTLALLALAAGGFAIGTTEFVTMGLLPEVAHGVHVDIPTAGHLVSAYAAGVVVGAPVLTTLGSRLPRKRLLLWFMGAFAVGERALRSGGQLRLADGGSLPLGAAAWRLLRRGLAGGRLARAGPQAHLGGRRWCWRA